MKRKILLIGANIEVVTSATRKNIEIFGVIDRDLSVHAGAPVLGDDQHLLENKERYLDCELVIAVDDCNVRDRLYRHYKAEGFTFGKLILSDVSPLAEFGEGCVVMPGAYVSDRTRMAPNCFVNFEAFVGHDNEVGQSTILAPRSLVLGCVKIGERTYVGGNSTVCPRTIIGSEVFISAGSTIADNLKSGMQVMGYYPLPKMHRLMPNPRTSHQTSAQN